MTSLGHKLTGVCAAFFAIAVMPDMNLLSSTMLVVTCIFGATAQDWLEIAWTGWDGKRKSIIPHRKITHWTPLWVGMLIYGLYFMDNTHSYLVVGFAVGGLTHLLVDLPNPMGVPIFHPWRNFSLNWWKSGQYELLIVCLFVLIDVCLFLDLDKKLLKGLLV